VTARVAFFALLALGLLAWAPAAMAHANLRSSDPAAEATLTTPPQAVTLTFTEPPEPSLAQIHVLDTSGNSVDSGPPQTVPGDSRSLRVRVKALSRGVYTVTWRVVSAADGHATAGAFAFGVGTSPAGAAIKIPVAKSPGPAPIEIAGRFVFIAGVFVLLGGAIVALIAFGDDRPALVQYVMAGGVVALAGVAVLAYAQQSAGGAGVRALLHTPIGHALVRRAVAVGAALAAAVVAIRARSAGLIAAIVLTGAAIYAEVDAGHATAVASNKWIAVGAQFVHFAAAAVWIGGLGALVFGVRGAASESGALAVKRFSTLAGACIAVVAATGVYRAVVGVGRWNALWTSGYGITVLVKSGLLGLLALLGARNRYTNVPAAPRDLGGLRRTSRVELSVALVVVVATALLAGLSPPPPAAVAEAAAPLTLSAADFGHTYRVTLEISPGYAGANDFRAHVTDYLTRKPAKVILVSLRFEFVDGGIGPSTLALHESKNGVWRGSGTNLSLDGRWTVTAVVQGATTSAEVPMDLATRCRTQVLSPGPPTIYTEQLAGGETAQTYLDPGKPGYNEIHFTFFDARGNELPVPANPVITAWRPGQDTVALEVRRFSAGHFIADGKLVNGRWRFESEARPRGARQPVRACFEQTVGSG
jgi:copper transport protein